MKIALSVALFSALIVAPLRAAETELDVKPAAINVTVIEEKIALRFVKPSLMAQWLDSRYAPLNDVGGVKVMSSAGIISLPEGGEKITPIDKDNVLLMRGTEAGIDSLREIIALLDKTIPMIQIDLQILAVESSYVSLTNSPSRAQTSIPDIVMNSRRFNPELWVAAGKARRLFAQSVTTLNNKPVR